MVSAAGDGRTASFVFVLACLRVFLACSFTFVFLPLLRLISLLRSLLSRSRASLLSLSFFCLLIVPISTRSLRSASSLFLFPPRTRGYASSHLRLSLHHMSAAFSSSGLLSYFFLRRYSYLLLPLFSPSCHSSAYSHISLSSAIYAKLDHSV
ncbi:hypothetical protein B0H19DRAFT_1308272 [Mycena capillaripes]|nr:hypothetical protein B0H19DRAFT_1308272 [Mycena capillaripes]